MGYVRGDNKTIEISYSTGSVTGAGVNRVVGGLVGHAESGTMISNSYWNTETTGKTYSDGVGAEGKTTDEMKNQTTFLGWDFTDIWEITSGNYPTLR